MGTLSLDAATLAAALPLSRDADRRRHAAGLSAAAERYGITGNAHRLRAFVAQVGHESGQLRRVSENLNYSASALRAVFGRCFPTAALAEEYARKPEMIANRVYAGRLGNGDEASGDGWRYRGRGLIQLTGRSNYREAEEGLRWMGADFVSSPETLEQPLWAAWSAAWWWAAHGLNELADRMAAEGEEAVMRLITKRINGGYNGWDDRWSLYKSARRAIG